MPGSADAGAVTQTRAGSLGTRLCGKHPKSLVFILVGGSPPHARVRDAEREPRCLTSPGVEGVPDAGAAWGPEAHFPRPSLHGLPCLPWLPLAALSTPVGMLSALREPP